MKVVAAEIFQFSLPLKKSLQIGAHRISHRDGLVLRLRDDSGMAGLGEVAPLPGLHHESLDQALEQVQSLLREIESLPLMTESNWSAATKQLNLYPSVRFGFESALLELVSQATGLAVPELLFGCGVSAVPVNALLVGNKNEILTAARRRVEEGYQSLKIKVGRKPVDEEAETIKALANEFGPQVSLRLDANRAWDMDEALAFARLIDQIDIEYIEEPLRDPLQLAQFAARSALPVALDESLVLFERIPDFVRAVIIKPSCMGIVPALERILVLGKTDVTAVISSAFESGLGLRILTQLSSFAGGATAMGLDTWRWLAADLTEPAFRAERGVISEEQQAGPLNLNASLLEPVK